MTRPAPTPGGVFCNIKEMGSRYLFIILNRWLERLLSRGDYREQKYLENQLQVWPR
jgi:hypothetical protein